MLLSHDGLSPIWERENALRQEMLAAAVAGDELRAGHRVDPHRGVVVQMVDVVEDVFSRRVCRRRMRNGWLGFEPCSTRRLIITGGATSTVRVPFH